MSEEQALRLDVDGYDNVTQALRDLFDSYPGLEEGEHPDQGGDDRQQDRRR